MKTTLEELNNWLETLESLKLPMWEDLPDIDLYMDQVITYLNKQLGFLSLNKEENALSAFMISNYVKTNLIPICKDKKYNKEHLSMLFAICFLKQILPLEDIKSILTNQNQTSTTQEIFDSFQETVISNFNTYASLQREKIETILKEDTSIESDFSIQEENGSYSIHKSQEYLNQKKELQEIASSLALEAKIKKCISENILFSINNYEEKNIHELEKEIQTLEKKKKEEIKKKDEK